MLTPRSQPDGSGVGVRVGAAVGGAVPPGVAVAIGVGGCGSGQSPCETVVFTHCELFCGLPSNGVDTLADVVIVGNADSATNTDTVTIVNPLGASGASNTHSTRLPMG